MELSLSLLTCDLSPEVEVFELHGRLESAQSILQLHAFFCAQGDSCRAHILELLANFAGFHFDYFKFV